MKSALPENEAERLNALRRYQILDTPPEPAFDRIVNALKQTNGKVSGPRGAAELLAMKPSTLASRISSLGIDRKMLEG
jgi:formate hydrogenlyase transcriptional activator